MRILKHLPLMLLVLITIVLITDNGFAQTSSFEIIADKFKVIGEQYVTRLKDYAFGIFKIFILVDVAIFGLRAALNRSEISEIISQFLMMLMFATFCVVAIKYYTEWTGFLLDKSASVAGAVNGGHVEFTPINTGWEILKKIIKSIPSLFFSPGSAIKALCFLILGGVIMVCFCLMGASMLVILCESYIAMSAAILLLGFGGSSMVKDYAINTMRYAVSVAFKLFTIRLVMGVGMEIMNELDKFDKVTFEELFPVLIASIVLLVLVRSLPETVGGIISGSHTGSGVGLGSAVRGIGSVTAGVASAGVGAVAGAVGMAQTVSRAQKIASVSGHGGVSGTAGQLMNAFSAARQQTGGYGGLKGTLRQTGSNIGNMYAAQQAMKNPNSPQNPYLSNPYLSPLSNRQSAGPSSAGSAESSSAGSSGGGGSQASSQSDNPYPSPLSNPQSSGGSSSAGSAGSSFAGSSGSGGNQASSQSVSPYQSPLSARQSAGSSSAGSAGSSSAGSSGGGGSQSSHQTGNLKGGSAGSSATNTGANRSSKRKEPEPRVIKNNP
ncbi:P-type conjugative transfer protein TrbL [Desulfosarcina sp. OttesenSCG-928-A07]|nr:P-type conjugative transfer protein TrbL [Desulfosarcina sp. OttesenSCG-928-G17]MDL2328471.1 P-type conjugative transfer protein TrbL [Desulfosarcina sp. OttesenSCG-928-A07]